MTTNYRSSAHNQKIELIFVIFACRRPACTCTKLFKMTTLQSMKWKCPVIFWHLETRSFWRKNKFVFNWKRLHKVVMMMWIKCRLYYRAAWHGKKIHSCHWAEGLCQLYLIYSDPSLHCGLKSIKTSFREVITVWING